MPFCTISRAAPISRATAGLASNVCGSVLGLLMIDETCTYLPPTWAMTSAYSFSAPIAVILTAEVAAAGDGTDEQALASRTAVSGRAALRTPERIRMRRNSRGGDASGQRLTENEHRY